MDADDIEKVIEEELDKLSVNLSDMGSDSDTDIEEDFTASNEKLENDLPDSVLTYFKASSNRLNAVEQLILEDLDDLETMYNEMFSPTQHADLLSELGSNFEDPLKLKERIMSEIEEQVGPPCETHDLNGDYDTEYETHKDSERQLMFEWRMLEERLRKEEEQRLAELEAEREQCLKSAREEEEKRRRRSEQFEEELRRTEATHQCEYLKAVEGDGEISQSLQLEMVEQQELIKRLEEQIAEERQVFEEVQQEERRRTETRCTAAATRLQAAFRGTLVRRWRKKELAKRREEERRRQEERKEMERKRQREERMKMEWEKERRRVEQEVQHHREEAERRRAEYERAKEQERHRLERERKLEEQRRKEKEEAKRIEDEKERKEEIKQKRMEERSVEEEMRKVQEDEEKKSKEKEKAKRIEDEIKRKDEEESLEMIEERTVEEVRGKVQEDEEKTRKEKEKTKRTEYDRKRKDEEKQKEMEGRRVEGEGKRKEVEEANRIEDERKRKEKEKQKSMETRRAEEEKGKVQVEEEKERKRAEEAKRAEDERKRKEEEKQKRMEERRVEENKKRKEGEEEKRTDAEIKRKEEEGKQKRMNEKRVVEEIRLEQKEQVKENETEQMQKEQRNQLKEKGNKGEEIVMKRNDDGQNMEERRRRNIIKDNAKGLVDQTENPETDKESENTTKWGKDETFGDNASQRCLSQSVNMSRRFVVRTLSSRSDQDEQLGSHLASALPTLTADNSGVTLSPSEGKSAADSGGPQCALDDSRSACLPDSTEQKRLAWMMNCTPWSKLSVQNKRKGLGAPPRKRGHRRASGHSLLPLPVHTVLRSGPWSSLKQVTSVTLEDLSGCSLSTLSECTRLQSLTLRRCRLQALDGLNQCNELQHIDLQENNITYVDCGGLARLEVLLLGRNQLMSIHGLDDAVNLTVLQLSHNIISRISGLGSLKKLHRLTVDHNQLISTRGLGEAFTLLHLDCSYNHLSHVEGLENCALLNTLDLRGNNLTELPMLKNHVLLRELYLDDNSICSLHGLESCWLPLLHCLSLPQNSITQLPLLVDLLSLKTLNVSHNCLSELRNICMSLQGCTRLQELCINDNPVQQENNWRSSVLAVNPNLIKLNGEQTGASGTLSADSTQLWSFQALCQAHQDQIDSVLQRHSTEISSAPSALHAQLLVGNHAAELFHLAEEQRYAHEYGDSGVCETATQEPVASSHLHELSNWDLAQEKSAEAKTQQPAEHKTLCWQAPHGCPGSCISPTQKFRDTQPSEDRYSRYAVQASRMDLKTMAAMVIQCCWREHRQRRRTGQLGAPTNAHSQWSPQREVKSCKTRPERLNKDYAATVVQAVWRGYSLRKRLARALMLAQISEGDEAFEEVDMDEFIFDEEAMERDWITLHSDMSPSSVLPYSEQLPLPKPLLPLPELHKSASVQPWTPRQAWISGEETPVLEPSQSPDPSTRMRSPASTLGKYSLSERSEKILEEWGLSSGSTARLMLKRAQRMKARKQQHQRKLLDPAVRLALFRKHNMRPVVMSIHRSRPEFREEIKAGRGDVSVQEALRGEPEQMQTQTRRRTYQWLQAQAVLSQRSSAPSESDHFLPGIDPEILNGGRVQLVASTGYREAPDSAVRQWIDGAGFSSPQNHQTPHTRTHSAGPAKKEVPSPQRVTLAPSRKERISFRDNPMQLSGGWGGGKKRSKANKLK